MRLASSTAYPSALHVTCHDQQHAQSQELVGRYDQCGSILFNSGTSTAKAMEKLYGMCTAAEGIPSGIQFRD